MSKALCLSPEENLIYSVHVSYPQFERVVVRCILRDIHLLIHFAGDADRRYFFPPHLFYSFITFLDQYYCFNSFRNSLHFYLFKKSGVI